MATTIQRLPCPHCTVQIAFGITTPERGAQIIESRREPHKAPCGLPCVEGSDVPASEAFAGRAHHKEQCACRREGRGYPQANRR